MMKLPFRRTNTRMTEKYNGRDDTCDHLAKWTKSQGMEPQPEWVHVFFHTLDTIPMNSYLETELHHATMEWDVFNEGFLLTFKLKDGFAIINEALQEIKEIIFRMLMKPMEWTQPDWSTQLPHAMEFYNVTVEEEDDDSRKFNIPQAEGHHEVKGP